MRVHTCVTAILIIAKQLHAQSTSTSYTQHVGQSLYRFTEAARVLMESANEGPYDPVPVIDPTIPDIPGWDLTYVHQFECTDDGPVPPDADVWYHQIGDGTLYGIPPGWGNGEPQIYTNKTANTAVVVDPSAVDGCALHITGLKQADGVLTSGRIKAKPNSPLGKLQPLVQPTGPARGVRIAARIHLPPGGKTGFFPAFWLLPTSGWEQGPDIPSTWVSTGEIDILEAKKDEVTAHAAVHFGGNWPDNEKFSRKYPCGPDGCRESYHEWALEWRLDGLKWIVDGKLRFEVPAEDWFTVLEDKALSPAAPFDKPFYVLLNLALGGNWMGLPTDDVAWPQVLAVDYITVHHEVLATSNITETSR